METESLQKIQIMTTVQVIIVKDEKKKINMGSMPSSENKKSFSLMGTALPFVNEKRGQFYAS